MLETALVQHGGVGGAAPTPASARGGEARRPPPDRRTRFERNTAEVAMAEAEAAAMSAPRHDVEAVGDEYAQRGAAVAFDAELVDSTERRRLEAEATDAFHPDGNGGGEAGDGSLVLTTALSAEEARFAAAPPLAGRRSPRPLAALSPPPTIHGYRATEQFYGCRAPEYLRAPPFTVGDDAGISWERPRDPLIVPRPPVAELYLSHCTSLMALPSTIDVLAHLVAIDLRSCTRLESLPAALARLPKVMATRMPRHGHSKPAVN